METRTVVIIVGGGPSGIAISACLSLKSIPHIVLEREDCFASLWKKRTYDRCHLHLGKQFCSLPFKPHDPNTRTFMTKHDFISYIDDYVSEFGIKPRLNRLVTSATYVSDERKWKVEAKNVISNEDEVYVSELLVVASGENSRCYTPSLLGLEKFKGQIVHSSEYKSGHGYENKKVLVVGSGNSGMEIAYDLSNYGVGTSVVIRGPVHVVTREIIFVAMRLLKYLPMSIVDVFVLFAAKVLFGDLSKYGIHRPKQGPFFLKATTGRSPVLDVGTISKIRSSEIKVLPGISEVKEHSVVFENGVEYKFDAMVFATGYKSAVCEWLKDYKYVLNDDGKPKRSFPAAHWKGENGLYCAGLSSMGLTGVSRDAQLISSDIEKIVMLGSQSILESERGRKLIN